MRRRLGSVLWLIVGVLVANSDHYFTHIGSIRSAVSAVLAIVLWPLLLLGINLHIK